MKIGPIDVGQFLLGTGGVILFIALFGLLVLFAAKTADRCMTKHQDGPRTSLRRAAALRQEESVVESWNDDRDVSPYVGALRDAAESWTRSRYERFKDWCTDLLFGVPRYQVRQFSVMTDRELPLGELFVYRRRIDALRAAVRYQALTRHSYFRVADQKSGEFVA